MGYLNKSPGAVSYAVLLALGMCANDAFAHGNLGADVDTICAQSGNTLQAQYQPAVVNNCTACHNDGNGGSGAGKTAYQNGTSAIIALFCPPAAPPPPPPPVQTCTDADGDGYSIEGGSCGPMDCNDNDPMVHPGATEICTDGIDNNCNNLTDAADPNAAGCPVVNCTDSDGDGYAIEGGVCGPVDCDDANPALNPGAIEICDDGIDNNCDASIDSVDATCQAMQGGDDPVLSHRHFEARRRQQAGGQTDGNSGSNGSSDGRRSRRGSGGHGNND
jgi:Putative metal-binding motif